MPVFLKARVNFTVIETQRTGHAIEVIAGMSPEELAQYQVCGIHLVMGASVNGVSHSLDVHT